MKKFLLFLVLAHLSFSSNVALAEESSLYAKVQSSGVYFYSMPSETSAVFEIPSSYFVRVESALDDFYKASYKNKIGYVKKNEVALMRGTPSRPYADANFKLFTAYCLYEFPNTSSTIVASLDTQTSLVFYGTKVGQQVSSTTNLWYYCSVKSGDQTKFGYVFSGVTDYLSPIETNTESFERVSEQIFEPQTEEFQALSTGTKIILIVSIALPSLLILYFLIKPNRITHQRKEPRRHKDYFEFDENKL